MYSVADGMTRRLIVVAGQPTEIMIDQEIIKYMAVDSVTEQGSVSLKYSIIL